MTTNILHSSVCYVCGSEATRISEVRPVAYGKCTIDVEDEFMRCPTCAEEFYGPGQAEATDVRASAAARRTDRILPFEIRAIRKKLGLTQRDLELEFGLGEKVVTRWERGLCEPPTPTVLLLRALESGALSLATLRPNAEVDVRADETFVGALFDTSDVPTFEYEDVGTEWLRDGYVDTSIDNRIAAETTTSARAIYLANNSLVLAA